MRLLVRTPPFWFYSPDCVEDEFSEVRDKIPKAPQPYTL